MLQDKEVTVVVDVIAAKFDIQKLFAGNEYCYLAVAKDWRRMEHIVISY